MKSGAPDAFTCRPSPALTLPRTKLENTPKTTIFPPSDFTYSNQVDNECTQNTKPSRTQSHFRQISQPPARPSSLSSPQDPTSIPHPPPIMSSTTTRPSPPPPIRILFVCLGNICRSPMAHGIFASLTSSLPAVLPSGSRTPSITLDSAGTGAYHAGSDPDPRTLSTLRKHGIDGFEHAARKVRLADFWEFDYVLAMDDENLEDLRVVGRRAERERNAGGARKGAGGEGLRKVGQLGAEGGNKAREDGEEGLARLCLFGDFGGREGEVIDDPWYGGGEGFEVAYKQCVRFSKGLLREILGEDVD